MARYTDKKRRPSRVMRDNEVHNAYDEVCRDIGIYANMLPRSYVYEFVSQKTGLCKKTIAFILNHTAKVSQDKEIVSLYGESNFLPREVFL